MEQISEVTRLFKMLKDCSSAMESGMTRLDTNATGADRTQAKFHGALQPNDAAIQEMAVTTILSLHNKDGMQVDTRIPKKGRLQILI
jgi:hypothetical protein